MSILRRGRDPASAASSEALCPPDDEFPSAGTDYRVARHRAGPVEYATVALSMDGHAAVMSCRDVVELAQRMARTRTAENFTQNRAPPWPLFSLQPCLLDFEFVRARVYPFSTEVDANAPESYWRWELEAALRFVKFGGTKATISSPLVARQIDAASSSAASDQGAARPARRAPGRKFAVGRRK